MKRKIVTFITSSFAITFLINCGSSKTYHTVSFDTNGGTTIESVKVEDGKTINPPTNPIKQDYEFNGWYVDKNCERTFDFEKTKIYQSCTIYAGWLDDPKIFNVTSSGKNIAYYKDEAMSIPLNTVKANKGEDFSFYMYAVNKQNDAVYILPTSLDIRVSKAPILSSQYKIDSVEGEHEYLMKKVTIDKSAIEGDIEIRGDAINIGYYKIDFPYFFGLEPIEEELRYSKYTDSKTIQFIAKKDSKYNDEELLTSDNIFINLTGDDKDWQVSHDAEGVKFEHIGNEYKLTIAPNSVPTNSNVVKIVARAKNYPTLDGLTWKEISNISVKGFATSLFDIGDTKLIKINNKQHRVRIIDFNHDSLANQIDEVAGITFEFENTITKEDGSPCTTIWNEGASSGDNYYFPTSIFNTFLNGTDKSTEGSILAMLPRELQKQIKVVQKDIATLSDGGSTYVVNSYYTKLFPLSYREITTNRIDPMFCCKEGSTYAFYKGTGDTDANRIKKIVEGLTGQSYWLRSPLITQRYYTWCVNSDGYPGRSFIYFYERAVAPAFCI